MNPMNALTYIRYIHSYLSTPLCRTHAADVLRNLHVITTRGGLMSAMCNGRKRQQAVTDKAQREKGSSAFGPAGMSLRLTKALGSVKVAAAGGLPSGGNIPPANAPPPTVLSGGLPFTNPEEAMLLLAVYLSAIIHDYDHRGLTNPFLIQDEDPLAVRGRGQGVIHSGGRWLRRGTYVHCFTSICSDVIA